MVVLIVYGNIEVVRIYSGNSLLQEMSDRLALINSA
jgi:hypothetical protein